MSYIELVGWPYIIKLVVFGALAIGAAVTIWYVQSPFYQERGRSSGFGDSTALPTADLLGVDIEALAERVCAALGAAGLDGEAVRRALTPVTTPAVLDPLCATIASLAEEAGGALYVDRVGSLRSVPGRFAREADAERRAEFGASELPDREFLTDTAYVSCPPGSSKRLLRRETWRWAEAFPLCPSCGGESEDGRCGYCGVPVPGERAWRIVDVAAAE